MKASTYNYIIPNGEQSIFFNGISEAFFEVPSEKAELYAEIIQNPSEYLDSFKSFIDKMMDRGFVLEDIINETESLEKKYHTVLEEDLYHIMILPTYQCNLRCWYCIQDHKNMWMSKETAQQIKDLLIKKIKDNSIKRIRLSWFGGEPLLGYNYIIDITSFAKHLTHESGKDFSCDITTNGTLLNRERITELISAGVTTYQITIDGDKATHDSIKVLRHGSAYDKTLENINIIAELGKCVLRFNYTHENLFPEAIIRDLKDKIKEENRHNVTFLLYKVWQESQEAIAQNDVNRLVDLSCEIGLNPILPTCNLCYADRKHFDCIFPNGKVEKCDNESPLSAKGQIVDGEIMWEGNTEAHIPSFKNSKFPCHKCKYVPICWGPCVAKRSVFLKETLST